MASRIYTKRGDDGSTGRFLGGRVSKADLIVETSGDVDEAVAVLGVARASCDDAEMAEALLQVQRELFVLGADVATHPQRREKLQEGVSLVSEAMVQTLEDRIDQRIAARPLEPVFLVPGTTTTSAHLDVARTVVRRAERHAVAARDGGTAVSEAVLGYLNRLSDLLYVLARDASGPAAEPPSRG